MRTNFVLIDYENVQTIDFEPFRADDFHVWVFLGESQCKISSELVLKMQELGERGKFIQATGNGPNALDFHIAFYIGQLQVGIPDAYFHIISKDAGFDPLLKHLKARKIFAARHKSVADAPFAKVAVPMGAADRAELYARKLRQPKATRPRTVTTLGNAINVFFIRRLTASEVSAVVGSLVAKGVVTVEGTKVSYPGAALV